MSQCLFPPSRSHENDFLDFPLPPHRSPTTDTTLLTATAYLQPLATMKLSAAIITLLAGSAAAFAPATSSAAVRSSSSSQQQTVMFAEPKEEEEGLDLDLGEMFDMYVTGKHYHYLSDSLYVVPFVWKGA